MVQLSIIIPVYNCADYLITGFEHLNKLYKAHYTFEIIYVNDGSTDNSAAVLEAINKEHEHINVIHQENQGSSGARNTAIDVATGQYIQFLDADDYIDVDKIIALLDTALDKKLDAIGYRLDYVNDDHQVIGVRPIQQVQHEVVLTGQEVLVQGFNPSSICVFLFSTTFLNKHHLRITPKITHMDIEFTSRVMMLAQKVLFKDVIAYHYLQRQGSITKPTSQEKLQKFLSDEIVVANLVRKTLTDNLIADKRVIHAVQKNYNSITWNLLWRFYAKKDEVPKNFKNQALDELKRLKLYPISGPLKSPFQKITRPIFNQEWLLKLIWR